MRERIAFILPVLFSALAAGQPVEVNRVLRTIDFEERRLGNDEDLPMNWVKVEGPGLPHYVNGRLATDAAHGGNYSFRFDLNGGSLVYRYRPGEIPVQPGAHYRIEGYCKTTVMPNARARLTAYLTDQDGHPIPSSTRHSELYAAKAPDEPWKKLAVELPAEERGPGWIVLELELLQPAQHAASALGDRTLLGQDIRGTAWFDDISVSQVPQVTMTTDRPGNIFRFSDALRLNVTVNDRFTDDLSAQLEIRDAEGKAVYQRSGALAAGNSEGNPTQKRMELSLPELKAGWYQAALMMSSQGQPLGEQTLDLIRLADDDITPPPDPRFGFIATDLPFDGWSELPQILPMLAGGRVKLALWSENTDVQQMDPAAFDRLLEKLQTQAITPTACLVDLPPALRQRLNGGSWPRLLNAPRDRWQPDLAYLISRHANHLDRWQLGADGSDDFVTRPEMRQVYRKIYTEFAALVEKPDLAMPWPAWYELDGDLPATVALSVPPSVLPWQIPLYIQDIKNLPGHNLSLSLELLDRERYGRQTQIRDLAQRLIFALSANATRIDVPLPFSVRRDGGELVKQPKELLLVLRTIMTTLSGSTFRGRVPLADGVEAFLFDRNGQGILALWDRGNAGRLKQLALNLGERPVSIDLWGNVTPLLRGGEKPGFTRLTVSSMPTFLVDIDGPQAQLRASVAMDRPLLESSFTPHPRHIRFVNTYRETLTGTLKLTGPAGWTISPPTFNFAINPGETFDRELTLEFPYNSYAGAKTIECQFAAQAETNSTFSVPLTVNLGLSDVGMQTLALRDGRDVIVQQMISNYGDKAIDYGAFAIFPGQARQERLVTALGAGRTTMKRYRFTNVPLTKDSKVRVGMKELDGMRILNDEVAIQ